MKSKMLESIAYHEAGHAVAAHWRRYPFKRVTIIPDKADGSLGDVLLKKLRSFNSIEWDITPTLAGRIADNIVISFAGGIAQRKSHKHGYGNQALSNPSGTEPPHQKSRDHSGRVARLRPYRSALVVLLVFVRLVSECPRCFFDAGGDQRK